MSTRFYPRFVKGNPQLRIFLPDWKMIMIKPKQAMPPNTVTFKTDARMTEWDIKNYLEKIYKVKVAAINSRICAGELKGTKEGIVKGDDYRIAHVALPIGEKFEWPDLFPASKMKELSEEYKKTVKQLSENRERDPTIKTPSWFL